MSIGQSVSVALNRMSIDNSATQNCLKLGDGNSAWTDVDLNFGLIMNYVYNVDNCASISKLEMLSRELLGCTFNPLVGDKMNRCTGNQSVAFYRSFLDASNTATPDIPVFSIDSKVGLRQRFEKACPSKCIQDRYLFYMFTIQ
jgi:hypothetical protein